MPSVSIATPFNIDLEFNTAPVGKRILAWLLDAVILLVYRLAFSFVIADYLPGGTFRFVLVILFLILPMLLYHFLMEVFFHGQSIGKKALGIRVVNVLGNEASVSQYLIRLLFRSYFLVPLIAGVVVSIFYDATSADWGVVATIYFTCLMLAALGMFLYYLLNKYGQRIGDNLANTLVIEDRAKADFHKTIYLEISDQGYTVRYPEVMRLTDRDINGIRNLLDVKRITREHEAYMLRIANRITEVLNISTQEEPWDFLAQLLRDYNYLTRK